MDQNPTPTPTPIVTPEAPAPAPAPVAPVASDNKNSNKSIIIAGVIALIVAIAVGVGVAIMMLNKPKEPASGSGDSGNSNTSNQGQNLSKCGDAFKCLEKIDEDATVESINELTGIEGKVSTYSDTTYLWEFPNDETLKFSTSYFSVEVEYDTDLHKDSSLDLSGYNTVKDEIKNGVQVDKLVEALGGNKGLLYKKDSFGTGYLWVDGDGGYLRASVGASGKITFISGRF